MRGKPRTKDDMEAYIPSLSEGDGVFKRNREQSKIKCYSRFLEKNLTALLRDSPHLSYRNEKITVNAGL